MQITTTPLLLVVLLAGCTTEDLVISQDYIGPNKVRTSRMAPHMQYRGFGMLRPADARWRADQLRQSPLEAAFYFDPISATHTFNAIVRNERIPYQPKSAEEFKAYVDSIATKARPRFELMSYKSAITKIQGQVAVRYELVAWDKAAQGTDQPLVFKMVGFDAIHPSWDRTMISAYYSERGKKDEVTGELDKPGEDFLSRVILESSPGVRVDE